MSDLMKGTTLGYWEIPLTDAQGAVTDLTGYQVHAMWQIADGTVKLRKNLQIVSATGGIVRHDLIAGDLDAAGSLVLYLFMVDTATGRVGVGIPVTLTVGDLPPAVWARFSELTA